MIEIKKGVPPPTSSIAKGRPSAYPFAQMVPGDMIEVSINAGESNEQAAQRARTAASSWRIRHASPLGFIVRWRDERGVTFKDEFGFDVVRVWAT